MMYEVYDKPKNVPYERLDRAVAYACDYLGLTDIFIEITFEKLGLTAGHCDIVDDVVEISVNRNLEGRSLELTIFHELVHVKQILDGKLVIGEGLIPSSWGGIIYTCPYYELPWEVEAYTIEKQMEEAYDGFN